MRRLGLAAAVVLGSTSCTAASAMTFATSMAQASVSIANAAATISAAERRKEEQRARLIEDSRSQLDGTGCDVQVKNRTQQGWTLVACGRELECWPRDESYACEKLGEAPL